MDCIFCDIINRKRQATIVYEDETVMAFNDVHPQAPIHILLVPKRHIPILLDMKGDDLSILGHLFEVANKIARDKEIARRGFRLVMNCNPESGQTIYHIHLHLLGGRPMHWPPG